MAIPDPLYVKLTDESYLTLAGVKYRERVEESEFYPRRTYRDDPQGLINASASGGGGLSDPDGAYIYAGKASIVTSETPVTYASDLVTHTPPRHLKLSGSKYVYRDSPPLVLSCTTVNGSNNLTVPTGATLIVGMAVSGTGIASGAQIASITNPTTVVLTQPSTAGATVSVTFAGNILGACWVDEWNGESGARPNFM